MTSATRITTSVPTSARRRAVLNGDLCHQEGVFISGDVTIGKIQYALPADIIHGGDSDQELIVQFGLVAIYGVNHPTHQLPRTSAKTCSMEDFSPEKRVNLSKLGTIMSGSGMGRSHCSPA